ncbi:MAG: gliding motility-associated C-terminal domain-containing protein [Sphingobacteriaceae bacterium]|nr:gliding motility-associated C-terminal domain-containing protein [Sphingobacteriaceae bacterium]
MPSNRFLFGGNKNFMEIWRIAFDNCNNKGVVSGGGISWPMFQTSILDTSLTPFNFIDFVSAANECCHDVNMVALDNYGNSYQTTVDASSGPAFANKLTKLPLPGFLPYVYSVNTNYSMKEISTIKYFPAGIRGYNGITISDTILYLYDSYVLQKFSTANGNVLNRKRISYPALGDSSKIYWGGLTSNDCNDIFLGDRKTVKQFDASLNQVNSFAVTDSIFDLKLDLLKGNLLYIGGKKFLSSVQINGLPNCGYTSTLNITTSAVNEDCINKGSGNVVITGSEPPYTVQWNTNPVSTGTAVTGLSTGSYVVSVTDNACYRKTVTDTIYVGLTNNLNTSITTSNNTCNSINNASANVSITSGTGPFSYAWSTGLSGTVSSLSNLSAGNYSVIISNSSGCKDTLDFIITEPVLKDTLDIYTTYCENDQQTLLKLNGTIATPPYSWYNLSTAVNNSNTSELSVPVSDINLYSLTWFYNGCKYKSSAIQVTVIKDLEPDDVKFTNVFTPNDDGINDVFYPVSRSAYPDLFYSFYDYELIILNRWGIKVFNSNLRGNAWDGHTESGMAVNDGTYFWVLNYKNKCGEKPDETKTIKGVVQLIR